MTKNTTKKTTKKTVKPVFVIDITECKDLYDTALAIAYAKLDGKQPLNDDNIDIITTKAIDDFAEMLSACGYINKQNHLITPVPCVCNYEPKKKPNIFKRMWNWLTGKKN